MAQPKTERAPKGVAALFARTRQRSAMLASRLSPEDMVVQSMPDASPAKWHLAHTTWFFETFVLAEHEPGFRPYDERFAHCFNSYYVQAGSRHARPMRGLLTRPSTDEVMAFRHSVDDRIAGLLEDPGARRNDILGRVELGCHHEMQHQELLLMDILHAFSFNPLEPAYVPPAPVAVGPDGGIADWHAFDGGVLEIGTEEPFSFDNEGPRHTALVHPFRIAGRLVTAGEWAEFIDDGGYETETLWLSDGWQARQREYWDAPMYWRRHDGVWWTFSLRGTQLVDMAAPVCHVSFYEAEAFARWAGRRLPSEQEWEVASAGAADDGNFVDAGTLRPRPAAARTGLRQMTGEVWQWTRSAYAPYPGFVPATGALGEYNGKFMVNQYVLRGASFGTARDHARPTYRNFFYPQMRWMFSGLRLAEDG